MENEDFKIALICKQINDALDVFEHTGSRLPFVALQDQLDAFADEAFDDDMDGRCI